MLKRFAPILFVTAFCWLVFVVNNVMLNDQLLRFGIIPRHVSGLPGIICAPFLHGSFQHLATNTVPLLILGGILCARSRGEFAFVTVAGILLSGGLTWLIGRPAYHVGASGLIFCFFGYIASLALFDRKIGSVLLSLVCIIGYGGILRGVAPTSGPISWEAHLAGLLAGIVLAWFGSKVKGAPVGPSTASRAGKLPQS